MSTLWQSRFLKEDSQYEGDNNNMTNLNTVLDKIVTMLVRSPDMEAGDKRALARLWADYMGGCRKQIEYLDRMEQERVEREAGEDL